MPTVTVLVKGVAKRVYTFANPTMSHSSDKGSIQSTPRSAKSSRTVAEGLTPPDQTGLMKLLDGKLELHVWEQEPELFARVLSPKVYNPDRTFKCLIDQDAIRKRLDEEEMQSSLAPFEGWGVGKGERTYYEPIAAFLNYCVAKCDTIYDSCKGSSLGPFTLREHSERFFENPFFVWFDKLMCDVINGAKPLKPDLLCVDGGPVDRIALKAYWSLVKEKWSAYKRQVAMPIEAKDSWRSLLIQIATYGPRFVRRDAFTPFRPRYWRESRT